jgi:hypothetical protein
MNPEERLKVILQEYAILRGEQGRRFDAIDKMTNYIILIMLGIAGAMVSLSGRSVPVSEIVSSATSACLPIFFSPPIFGYLHNEIMIFRIGRYIHGQLAREVNRDVLERLLGWDAFNVREATRFFPIVATFFRNLILVLPIIVPTALSVILLPMGPRWINVLLGVDIGICVTTIAVIAYKGIYFLRVADGRASNSISPSSR